MPKDIHSILTYHLETSHVRRKITSRRLNPEEYPLPFKRYPATDTSDFILETPLPHHHLDTVLERRDPPRRSLIRAALSEICQMACGITLTRQQTNGMPFHFRSVASAGGLYPAELYFAIQNVNGMHDGLYHFCPLERRLTLLRSGYIFGALSGNVPIIRFYTTSIYHRSAWKYGARAYRYCLLDTGHMAENVLLATRLFGFPAQLDYDFNDRAVGQLLGIDPVFEGCLAQIHVLNCKATTDVDGTLPLISDAFPSASRTAPKATAPDLLLEAHQATSSFARCPIRPPRPLEGEATPLPTPKPFGRTHTAISKRHSKRNFISVTPKTGELESILSLLCQDKPPICTDAIRVGFIAGVHSGLIPGFYRLNRADNTTTLLKSGNLTARMAQACLDQSWLENAALHLVFTANLDAMIRECGPRSYRYAHLEAGRLGQLAYLAATSRNMGACGIGAFFDEEAKEILSLPDGHAFLYLVALGPVRK